MAVITGSPSSTTSATPSQPSWWLKNPVNAAQNTIVKILSAPSLHIAEPEDAAFFAPLGRTRKVKVTDVVAGQELKLTFYCGDQPSFDAIRTLRNGQQALLLQNDTTQQWYVVFGGDFKHELKLYGDRTNAPRRYAPVTLIEVDAP